MTFGPDPDTPEPIDSQDEDLHDRLKHTRETFHELLDVAIEAEKLTGRKEETDLEAKRSLLLRAVTITFGSIVTFLGILMLALPGPGMLVTAIGLGILSKDIPFARRLAKIAKDRLPQDNNGQITKGAIVSMLIIATLGIALSATSIWWTFWR